MMKKILKIGGIVIGVLLVLYLVQAFYVKYKIDNGDWVRVKGTLYKKADVEKAMRNIYGPQVYSVESKNTPEEVYAKFREALLKGDKEEALKYVRKEKYQEYKEAFVETEKYKIWINSLPVDIKKEGEDGNLASYDLNKGDGYKHTVLFVKSREGYWEIDSI